MSNPLRTLEDYELFLYTLTEQFKSVRHSTVTLVRRGASLARVSGEVHFEKGLRLVLLERIVADRLPAVIEAYGYEIWRGEEKLCWYDSQPHPEDPALASTHPHHQHVPPDLKNCRVPAPEMNFTSPNLPALIAEIERLLEGQCADRW
ncbi:MAG TPA: DUF6516 family protein, partial [Candidatus Acidoferrum sp.]|nr:DUF6516 family protein [Candidatus Acidoferrum sp.]